MSHLSLMNISYRDWNAYKCRRLHKQAYKSAKLELLVIKYPITTIIICLKSGKRWFYKPKKTVTFNFKFRRFRINHLDVIWKVKVVNGSRARFRSELFYIATKIAIKNRHNVYSSVATYTNSNRKIKPLNVSGIKSLDKNISMETLIHINIEAIFLIKQHFHLKSVTRYKISVHENYCSRRHRDVVMCTINRRRIIVLVN